MMGEASKAVAHHEGGREDGGGATGGWASSGSTGSSSGIGSASSGWSSSLFSSTTTWSVGDEEEEDGDGATSSSRPAADRRRHSSSLSSSSSTSSDSEASQMDGAGGGPLYRMSTIGDHLPPAQGLRTGLSMYYQGRSESFTSLADVSCVEDLAKKTTPYIRRPRASRHHAAALGVKNTSSKTVAKKAPSGRKPSTASECQGKERAVQVLGHAHANEISPTDW